MSDPSVCTKKLEGKVAIITGGASGIGEATAHLFANHGALAVVIADIDDERAHGVVEAIGSDRCCFVHCDITDEQQVQAMVQLTIKKYGTLHIMFSNAGIVSKADQTILDLELSQLDQLYASNVRGTAACFKHAARAMVERRVRGSIVCTASVTASRGAKMRTDYVMSKHAVLGLVRSASLQLGVHGIRVNCVSPSALVTRLSQHLCLDPAVVHKKYEPFTSLKGTILTAKHVGDAVLFLASDDSEFITGHDLAVDGGLTAIP